MFSNLFSAPQGTQGPSSSSTSYPSSQVATTTVADIKKPRAKVKARKLPPWEQASDLEDERNKDSLIEDVRGPSQSGGQDFDVFDGQSAHALNYVEAAAPSAAMERTNSKKVLKSYEETVLRSPETHQSTLLEKEEEEDDDDNEDNQDGYPSARSSSSESVEGRGKATFEEKWQEREDELQREIREKKDEAQRQKLAQIRSTQAARTIQMIVRMKHDFKKQRMQYYYEAEDSGRDQLLREKKLLVWVGLFSVLQKFDDHLQKPNAMSMLNAKVLKGLPAPPPPPPKGAPPSKEDELLHDEYEKNRALYMRQWTREGEMTLGKEKFEEMRKNPMGLAEKQKELIARVQMRKAMKAMSEKQFQDCLKKAWRLMNDWQPDSACDTQEFLETHKDLLAQDGDEDEDVLGVRASDLER
mmetsp:Transcript_43792/g.101154  ORF Transcript_43792/g.101154 Transcript_43792/m.101154 type:complete len:413 (-) Transcript_43792:67-1305(-)